MKQLWSITTGRRFPVMAVALHDGHEVRPDVAEHLIISESDRLREEDPFTGEWTAIGSTRIVVRRSRFEVDLNRPRQRAVYLTPDDAWGLTVWREQPPVCLIEQSLAQYDTFYTVMAQICTEMQYRFGRFVIFDLHSYNHRRAGAEAPPANSADNPEINIGTGSMNREAWASLVDGVIADLRSFDFLGRQLDVRENVRFTGGHFSRWVHHYFPESACVLAIEAKKFFMDEWTHQRDTALCNAVQHALQSTVPGVLERLNSHSDKTYMFL